MELTPEKRTHHPLLAGNPMLVEIVRFRRKYFSFAGPNAFNRVVLGLIGCCYTGLVLLVVAGKGDIPPVPLLFLQTAAFVLFAPMILNNSIAGERERRSWDLLAAAPITHAQIIAGKFIGALSALALGAAGFLVPILVAWAMHGRTPLHAFLLAELVSISFGGFCCALTIFFSARVKRGFMALGASLGLLIMGLLVIPSFLAANSYGGSTAFSFLLNPFWSLSELSTLGERYQMTRDFTFDPILNSIIYSGVYIGLTLTLLVWAEKTVHFPDNEVKFIPRSSDNA